jgi:hypothetical protein
MKKTRKLVALIIVLTMMFALAIPALAAKAPEVDTAIVTGNSLVITFDEPIQGTAAATNFTVDNDGTPVTVSTATVAATTVTLGLAAAIPHDATNVTVQYDGLGSLACVDTGNPPVAAFDEDVTVNTSAPGGTGDIPNNTVTVPGAGTSIYVDTTVYSVVLPTAAALNFTLDPQGLAGLADGATATQTSLAATAGKVIATSTAPTLINRSSVPVNLTAAITATAGAGTGTAPTLVQTVSAVDTGTDMNVLLAVVSSTDNVNTPDSTAPFAGTYAVPLVSATALNLTYRLAGADFQFVRAGSTITYDRISTSLGNGTQIQLAGLVNKNANWSTFGTLAVSAVFTFAPSDGAVITPITGAFGLFGSYTPVTGVEVVTPGPVGPQPGFTVLTGSETREAITRTAAATNFPIPFRFNDLDVKAVETSTDGGSQWSALTQGGASGHRYTVNGAGTETGSFTITLISATARIVRITLSNDSVYTVAFS